MTARAGGSVGGTRSGVVTHVGWDGAEAFPAASEAVTV